MSYLHLYNSKEGKKYIIIVSDYSNMKLKFISMKDVNFIVK